MTDETPATPVTPTPEPSPNAVPPAATSVEIAENAVDVAATDTRKAVENTAKQHINSIWQKLENAVEWPIERLDVLIKDLEKHV